MKRYSPGEIVEAAFPYEESEDEKVRPVLVLKDYGDELLVAKITSRHKSLEWDIEIPVDGFNGLTKASVIQANRCGKIPKTKLSAIIPRGIINPLQLEIEKSRIREYLKHQSR